MIPRRRSGPVSSLRRLRRTCPFSSGIMDRMGAPTAASTAVPPSPFPARRESGRPGNAPPNAVSTENSCEQVPHIIYIGSPTLAPLYTGNPSPRDAFCKGRCLFAKDCPTTASPRRAFWKRNFFVTLQGHREEHPRRAFEEIHFHTSVSAARAHTFYTEFRHSTDRDYG